MADISGGSSGMSMPSFPWEISQSGTWKTSQSGEWKVSQEKMSKDRFIQECAIMLFGNVDFKNCGVPVEVAAADCASKARILAQTLKSIHG